MIVVMMVLVSACDLLLTSTAPYIDVFETLSTITISTASFTLCLFSSSDLAFSLEQSPIPLLSNITIQ